MTDVVAIVVAKGPSDRTTASAAALREVDEVDRVVEVDDRDRALAAAVAATSEADVYLLVDADLESPEVVAGPLLEPVLRDEADMAVAVPASRRRGLRGAERLAARGIRRGCGWTTVAPLPGARAVRAEYLRGLPDADGFGLDVALSVDAVRRGARVVEVPVPAARRSRGRSWRAVRDGVVGGWDVLRALWPRLTGRRTRVVIALVLAVGALLLMSATSQIGRLSGEPPTRQAERVVLFGIPHLGLDDLDAGTMPNLDELVDDGAMAAASVRTYSPRPSTLEAYATLSAGARVLGDDAADKAYAADDPVEGSTAAKVTQRRSGKQPSGEIVLPGGPRAIDDAGSQVPSLPGALGSTLADHRRTTAVVGNADEVSSAGEPVIDRPAAIGAMHDDSSVDTGAVGDELLREDPSAPYGRRVDAPAFLDAARDAMRDADLTILDPGETDRAFSYGSVSGHRQAAALRRAALRDTDRILGSVVDELPAGTLLLVVGMTPPTRSWALTPVVAHGAGVVPGRFFSPSTKRPDLVTLTDVSTTILDALAVPAPDGMIGQPLEYRTGHVSLARLERTNDVAAARERVYYPMALSFIIVQAVFYLVMIVALALAGAPVRSLAFLRVAVLTFASWPLATYIVRMWPPLMTHGGGTHLLVWVIATLIALVAGRFRRHPLAPLGVVTGVTALLLLVDVATGARLQAASILGYSPHTAARFYGFGNTAFAVLSACALISAVLHVERSSRRQEAVLAAALFLAVVVVADGAPWLGSDVGGILSLVPVFGLTVVVLSGRRISARTLAIALAGTIAVLGLAVGADLLRSADSRTHLASFVVHSGEGDTFWTTISRKWSTNQRVFRQSIWTWMVPIIAVFGGYVLVVARGWRQLLPDGSALRAGVIGVLAAGVAGWLVNDSGIVVTALIFVYLGPYLTLLAIEGRSTGSGAPT
jgi:hypothetical protein